MTAKRILTHPDKTRSRLPSWSRHGLENLPRRILLWEGLAAVLLSAAIGGCHKPAAPMGPTRQSFVVADSAQVDALWETCQTVLRHNRFALDRVDRRAGVITTHPVTSQQFLEFWRHDVDTAYDLLHASLHTARRRATVAIQPTEDDPLRLTVSVTVNAERLSAPERQFNNSAMALRFFGGELPGEAGEPRLSRQTDYWIDQGRDPAMERRILNKITDQGIYVAALPSPPP